jgi:hypothetical protein
MLMSHLIYMKRQFFGDIHFLTVREKKGGQTTETRVPQPRLGFSQHASIRPSIPV